MQGEVLPVVYSLLPNKTQAIYERLLDVLLEQCPDLDPRTIVLDFEQGAINAFRSRFPEASIKGCFFHLCQNVYKHVQSNGLQERYRQDADFALSIRMIPALAFVPPGDVINYYEHLENFVSEDADRVLSYFEKYYVGRLRQNGVRRAPMFPHKLWNVHQQTLLATDRTNIAHEGWHRRFASQVTCHHPTIWKFIGCLIREEQRSTEQRAEQLVAGERAPARKKKYDM